MGSVKVQSDKVFATVVCQYGSHKAGRIILPLAANGILAAAVFVVVFAWNEYVFALIFTTRAAKTTPLVISEILSTVEGVDWGILFAAATVQLAPILIFVIAVQRYLITGLAAGSLKG